MTDSNYCLDLLGNATQILEWAKMETKEEFYSNFNGPGPLHFGNPDILYPLSRTYFRLHDDHNNTAYKNSSDPLSKSVVQVQFQKETLNRLGDAAQLAAQLMYGSVK
jgi:hypothetical protein